MPSPQGERAASTNGTLVVDGEESPSVAPVHVRSITKPAHFLVGAGVGVVLVWSRLVNLGTSFWGDEAYSAFYYANRGPRAVFFERYVPNDHPLYELLSWVTTRVVGQFEAAYRFWSVVPALAAVALIARWLWTRVGPFAAAAVIAVATVSPVHLVLAPQARGYGLAMLAGAVMLVGATRASDRATGRDVAVFTVGALVGIWTLPVFVLAAGAQAAVLLTKREIRRITLAACGFVAVASLVFYAPMLREIVHNAHQNYGSQLPWDGFFMGPYNHLAQPTIANTVPFRLHSWLNGAGAFAVIAVLTAAAGVRLVARRDRVFLAHLVVPVFGTYVALDVGRFYVQPRFASYLLFHVVVLLAVGAQTIWDGLGRSGFARLAAALGAAVLVVSGCGRVVSLTKAQAQVPWENKQFVGRLVDATGLRRVVTDSVHPGALYFYVGEKNVTVLDPGEISRRSYCSIDGAFIFVDDRYHQTVPLDDGCLIDRGATKLRVPQQARPPIRNPGDLFVYVVPGRVLSTP